MKKIIVILLSVAFIFLSTSCATLFSGNTDEVVITTSPADALVSVNGIPRGYTPLTLELEKGESYSIRIEKEGYQDGYATISDKVGAGWVVLDVFTGLAPLIIDAVTGSWSGLEPDSISLALMPLSAE